MQLRKSGNLLFSPFFISIRRFFNRVQFLSQDHHEGDIGQGGEGPGDDDECGVDQISAGVNFEIGIGNTIRDNIPIISMGRKSAHPPLRPDRDLPYRAGMNLHLLLEQNRHTA